MAPEKLQPSGFSITEIPTTETLIKVLSRTAINPSVFSDPELSENLQLITELTAQAERSLFVTDTPYGPWCIVAPKKIDIFLMKKEILAAARLQDAIIPEKLRGNCGEIAAYAKAVGIADGILNASDSSDGPTIYDNKSFHRIGYKTGFWSGNILAFDLTAKAYVFAKGTDAQSAPAQGLMVVENGYETATLNTLYATTWGYWPETPNPITESYAINDMKGILKE